MHSSLRRHAIPVDAAPGTMGQSRAATAPSLLDEVGGTVVCVIGTPRSGTSLTARILNLAGVFLGPEENMVPAGALNPKGFWENRAIVELNRRLLSALGQRDLMPPEIPSGWAASQALAGERAKARRLLAETFRGRPLWGWKDPSTTLVLPFWQHLLPSMRYVICLRNPVDIGRSAVFMRQTGITVDEMAAAWPRHVAAALAYTEGHRRMIVFYDDYLDARRETVERLWRFIGNGGSFGEEDARRLEDPIDDGLLHHRTPSAQIYSDRSLPLEATSMLLIADLLRRLDSEQAGGPTPAATTEAAVGAYATRLLGSSPAPSRTDS